MVAYYKEMLPGFTAMCQWVVDHAEERNIVAFLHTGDMVDNPNSKGQWDNFTKGMELIAPKMPIFVTLGNHDYFEYSSWPLWMQQFYFKNIPEDHAYRSGLASYSELAVDDTNLLLLQIAFREAENMTALNWLKGICNEHIDWPAILVVHGYLTNDGRLMNMAQHIEKVLVSQCPNIRLILCGHSRGISHATFMYDDDGDGVQERAVNVIMHDLQQVRDKYGYLNLLTYDPAANSLSVDSYSPFLDDYIYDDEHPDAERFVIENLF